LHGSVQVQVYVAASSGGTCSCIRAWWSRYQRECKIWARRVSDPSASPSFPRPLPPRCERFMFLKFSRDSRTIIKPPSSSSFPIPPKSQSIRSCSLSIAQSHKGSQEEATRGSAPPPRTSHRTTRLHLRKGKVPCSHSSNDFPFAPISSVCNLRIICVWFSPKLAVRRPGCHCCWLY
jgi:hypothetical protein